MKNGLMVSLGLGSISVIIALMMPACSSGDKSGQDSPRGAVNSAPTDLPVPRPAVTPPDTKTVMAEDPAPAEAEDIDTPDPGPRKGDKGRLTAESEGEDVFVVKNPDPIVGAGGRLKFNDRCCADAITCVIVGFLGEDLLVRAAAVDAAGPLTAEEEPCAACPVGTLFLVDPAYWPRYAEDQLEYEAEQKTIEAEKEQIRRLLRQEKRQIVEQE